MKGYQFRRQRPVLNYVADFLCKELKAVIEVDGSTHHWEETGVKDLKKEKDLIGAGFKVLRFTEEEVLKHIEGVRESIVLAIQKIEQSTPLIPRQRGDSKLLTPPPVGNRQAVNMKNSDKLIINSPYKEPKRYWEYIRDTWEFVIQEGRRPAGYIIASESPKSFDDPETFIEIELVNAIRPRIKKWREQHYPGVTGITKRLLQHWQDPEEHKDRRFFFCQLEAIETLIWLTEAPEADRTGIDVPNDGGDCSRWCSKSATFSISDLRYKVYFGNKI